MNSAIEKHSVIINGHKTSVSLEEAFWNDLKEIAHTQRSTLSEMVGKIDSERQLRQQGNLSSALRLFVLEYLQFKRFEVAATKHSAAKGETAHALQP